MTPEQRLKSRLAAAVQRILPKGRWLWQPIETSTSIGVPDIFFSFSFSYLPVQPGDTDCVHPGGTDCVDLTSIQFWIEAKTMDYHFTPQQVNWAIKANMAGVKTYCATATRLPTANSTAPTHTNPYPVLTEQPPGPSQPRQNAKITRILPNKNSQETSILLAVDPAMLDYSSLGSYFRAVNPPFVRWSDYLTGLRTLADKCDP